MRRVSIAFLILIFVAISTFFCRRARVYPVGVQHALSLAGDNADELVKVLEHYRSENTDSLKYKAACFLIENMPYHFSFDTTVNVSPVVRRAFSAMDSATYATFFSAIDSNQFNLADYLHNKLDSDEFIHSADYVDSLVKYSKVLSSSDDMRSIVEFEEMSQGIATTLQGPGDNKQTSEISMDDLRSIRADWLIDHVDNAFRVWQQSPYCKNLSFTDFKETILAYRSLYEWPDVKSSLIYQTLNRIIGANSQHGALDLDAVVRRLNFYMYCLDVFEDSGERIGRLGFYDILQFYKYDCDRHSEWTVRALNACGIPARLDFTSGFFDRNKLHYGVSVRELSGIYRHFTPKWQALGDTNHRKMFSKVFRRTFRSMESPFTMKAQGEAIPTLFGDPFLVDVTEQYHKVVRLTLPLSLPWPPSKSVSYLAIFTPAGWKGVGWGKLDQSGRQVTFEKVPVGASYVFGYYDNGHIVPMSQPFLVNDDGSLHYFVPEKASPTSLSIFRKYPHKSKLVNLMRELDGAKIEGSDNEDFKNSSVLYIIKNSDIQDFKTIVIEPKLKRKFRYIRINGSLGHPMNIAGLQFYSTYRGRENEELKVKALPSSQPVENAFDGNNESYVNSYSIAVDLGYSQRIDEIKILPRNADNEIKIGDEYELFYFDERWVSLGRQRAKSNVLKYGSIPKNCLLWLKNHSRGKEEQIFIERDGRQHFLNSETIL